MPGLKARKASWDVLQLVAAGVYSDVALKRVFHQTDLIQLDKGLATEIAYGAIRQRYLLDCWINHLGAIPALKQPPLLRWLLHIGLYQILFMDRVPDAAIVNTSVELAKRSKLSKLSIVVNGILRAAARKKEEGTTLPLPKKYSKQIAQLHSLPNWLVQNLIEWEGEERAEIIATAFNQSPPIDLRINPLNATIEEIQKSLVGSGITSNPIKKCPYGLEIKTNAGDIRNWPGYKQGKWCVQDRAAQWVAPLLDPQPNERILDACAAPGGKSTHIAEIIGNQGEIWAIDRSEKRLHKVILNAKRLGLSCLNFLQADSCNLLDKKPAWENYFQKILIDAPCSGLGTLARNPDARWRIKSSMLEELIILQKKLLEGLLPLLAENGRIVYATCTINPAENSQQIESFTKKHANLKITSQKQIWPGVDNLGDGFYAAIIDCT